MQSAINLCKEVLFSINANCTTQIVLTLKKHWGLNLAELMLGLRIQNLTASGEVIVKWQWSLDSSTWTELADEIESLIKEYKISC